MTTTPHGLITDAQAAGMARAIARERAYLRRVTVLQDLSEMVPAASSMRRLDAQSVRDATPPDPDAARSRRALVRSALRAHGDATARELSRATGLTSAECGQVAKYDPRIVRVGKSHNVYVWGYRA